MKYRPKDWQKILAANCGAIAPQDAKLIETGADALLEALRKEGTRIAKDWSGDYALNFEGKRILPAHNPAGTLVFIPDE